MKERRRLPWIALLACASAPLARATEPSGPRWVRVIDAASAISDEPLAAQIRTGAAASAAAPAPAAPAPAPVAGRRVSAPEAKTDHFEEITKEIADNVAACAVDRRKLLIGVLTGEDVLRDRTRKAMKDFAKIEAALKADGIALTFSYSKEIAQACKLGDKAKRFNVGSAEALRYVGYVMELQSRGRAAIQALDIEIGPLSGKPLYEANRAAVPSEAEGIKTLTIKVNAGDYETGLAVYELKDKIYAEDPR